MAKRRDVLIGSLLGAAAVVGPALAQEVDTVKLREELMVLEKASWGFMRDKNLEGMRNYLTDDGLLIFADGKRYDKREILALMPDFRLDSIAYDPNYSVRVVAPGVAILLYKVTYTASVKGGRPETVTSHSSNLYVRRNNRWWSLHYQESAIR